VTDWTTPRSAPVGLRPQRRPRTTVLDRLAWLRHVDVILLGAVASLLVIGTLLVWAATKPAEQAAGLDPNTYLKKQLLNVAIGLVLAVLATAIDYRTLRTYTPVLYVGCLLGLLAVMSPLGTIVNGAHSWISLGGGFEIQPSEFTKLALILALAVFLAERGDRQTAPSDRDVVAALALTVVPLLLIAVEPDLGVVLVCLAIVVGMLAISGVRARWLLGLLVVGVLGSVLAIHLHLLKSYQLQRLTSFTHPNSNASTSGYNTHQATIAVGSGGLTGAGLFHGTQTNGGYVPEAYSDFIFTVAGEELGFAGSALIVVLTGVVLWRGLRIAGRTEDLFGRLVAVGVVCWFAFQGFENIGMTLGIMPVTGIPLPFVSYGGSALFACMLGVGLLQNVRMRALE
jgi:rod shape determining protein RodA